MGRITTDPTILVIDDLHWADASTLLLLRHLLRVLDTARLLVIATFRDDEAPDPALAEAFTHLHRMDGCHTLRLGGLDPDQVTELLAGAEIPDAAAMGRVLHERTGGNPFYLGQVLSAADERPDSFDPFNVPDTVSELVRHRVVMLPNDARDVLALAATIGTTVRRDVLTEAMRIDGCRPAAVDVLVDRHVLLEVDPDAFAFTHALARDAVYGQLPRTRRRRLHLTVAGAVAALGGSSVDWAATLSHHYLLADDPAHAREVVDATVRAADHSLDVLAYEQRDRAVHQCRHHARAVRAGGRPDRKDPPGTGGGTPPGRGSGRGPGRPWRRRSPWPGPPARSVVFAEAVLELVAKGGRGVAMDMADPDRADLLAEAADRLDEGDQALLVSVLAEQALALLLTDQVDRRHAAAAAAHAAAMATDRPEVVARGVVAHRLLLARPDGAAGAAGPHPPAGGCAPPPRRTRTAGPDPHVAPHGLLRTGRPGRGGPRAGRAGRPGRCPGPALLALVGPDLAGAAGLGGR